MSEYMDYIADVNDVQDSVNDLALKMYEQGRADAIDECKTILKTCHMFRTCEDDYNAKIEVPFYKGLWKSFEQLKEQK